jgi:putative NADPH-quinone reductase
MKKLIITANPSSEGFSHKIADKLKELSLAKNDEVEILDLYKTNLKQDYLRYEKKSEI